MGKWITGFAALLGGGLMFAAQTPYEDARSNLESWLDAAGVLIVPVPAFANTLAFYSGVVLVLFGVFNLIVPRWGPKADTLPPEGATQAAKLRVFSALLGALMRDGRAIFARERTSDPKDFNADVEQWSTLARDLILDAFGEGESELFLNSSGYSFDARRARNPQNTEALAFVDWRLRRLSELIQRVPALTVSENFDFPQWESRQEEWTLRQSP